MAAVTEYIKESYIELNPKGNLANLARIAKQRNRSIGSGSYYCPVNIWHGPANTFCSG